MTIIQNNTIKGSQCNEDVDLSRYLIKHKLVFGDTVDISATINGSAISDITALTKDKSGVIEIRIPNEVDSLVGDIKTNATRVSVIIPDNIKSILGVVIQGTYMTKLETVDIYYNGNDPSTTEQVLRLFLNHAYTDYADTTLHLPNIDNAKAFAHIMRRIISLTADSIYKGLGGCKIVVNGYPITAEAVDGSAQINYDRNLIKSIFQSDNNIDYSDLFDLDDKVVVQAGYFSSSDTEINNLDTIYSAGAMYSHKYKSQICTVEKYTEVVYNDRIRYTQIGLNSIMETHKLYHSLLAMIKSEPEELKRLEDCYKQAVDKYKEVEEYGYAVAAVNCRIEDMLLHEYSIDIQKVLIPLYYHADRDLFAGYIIKIPGKYSMNNEEKVIFRHMSKGEAFGRNFYDYSGNNREIIADAIKIFEIKSHIYSEDKTYEYLNRCYENVKLLGQDILLSRDMQLYYKELNDGSIQDLAEMEV